MFNNSAKKDFIDLTVRISYDEKTDTISFQSKGVKRRYKRKLDLSLKGPETDYSLHNLHYFLEREGVVPEYRFKTIPENLNHTHATTTEQWDKFPLGRFADGEETIWDSSQSSNLLIAGGAGTGKTVIQRNIILHCLRHPENWVFYGIDLLRVELTPYLKYGKPITKIATTASDALTVVTKAHTELNKRYLIMEQAGVNSFRDLPEPLPAWMIMIDEASYLLANTGSQTDEGKKEDLLREELKYQLADIARLGRSAGINLVLTTNRAESETFPESFKEDFTTRIALGRMHPIESHLLLGSDKTNEWAGAVRGRGYFQQFDEGYDFQAYGADKDLGI